MAGQCPRITRQLQRLCEWARASVVTGIDLLDDGNRHQPCRVLTPAVALGATRSELHDYHGQWLGVGNGGAVDRHGQEHEQELTGRPWPSPDTEFTTSGLLNTDSVTSVTLTSAEPRQSATVGGSPYSVVPSGAVGIGLGNYTISYVNGNLTVIAAALTITASSGTMTYGGTPPSITASYSGFVNGDGPGSLTTPPTCSSGATSQQPCGYV